MYQINGDIPLGCIYESQDGSTKYCPMLNHDDVPYCQWFEDNPEAAIGIDERPVYCPILPSAHPEQPTIEPERKRGKWIQNENGTWSCNQCHSWIPDEQHYYAKYCLCCGSQMEDGEDDVNYD